MSRRLIAVFAAVSMLVVVAAGPAFADVVGEPGTPNCFGKRISHGSSDHGLTPKERAPLLEELIVNPALDGAFGSELQQVFLEFFGDDGVSVQETIRWIRVNCSDEPIFIP